MKSKFNTLFEQICLQTKNKKHIIKEDIKEEYIVLFETFDGFRVANGTFNTIDKAINWMNDDYVQSAKKVGYKIKIPFENKKKEQLNIENYGSWLVLKIYPTNSQH